MDFFYDDKDSEKDMYIYRFLVKWSKNRKHPITSTSDINKYSIKYGGYEVTNHNKGTIKDIKNCTKSARAKYPTLSFTIGGQHFAILNHIFVALMYVPNPDPKRYTMINHKDGNTLNCSKENLEWCDAKINNLSKNRRVVKGITRLYQQIDPKTGEVVKEWTTTKDLIADISTTVPSHLNKGTLYRGYLWIRRDMVLEDYLSRHPKTNDNWYKSPFFTDCTVEVNDCGIIRVDGVEKVGQWMESKEIYRVRIKGEDYQVHRIVFETISGIKLEPGDCVIHIQPVTKDDINNEFSNLRLRKGK